MSSFKQPSGRRAAFSELVRAHGVALTNLARRIAGAAEAEDIVQAALTSAWRHFGGLETLQNPRSWLLRFVVHECGNVVGRRMRRPVVIEFEDGAAGGSTDDIVTILQREIAYSSTRDPRALMEYLDEGLSAAVQALTEDERVTLTLRAVGEFSYREISDFMGVPVGTVMSRLCRTREKVRVDLDRRRAGGPSRKARSRGAMGAEGGCAEGSKTR